MSKGDSHKFRHLLEYILLRATGAFVRLLPRRWSLALGRGIGRILYLLGHRRRRVAIDNLTKAYDGDLAPEEIKRMARETFSNVAQSAVEAIWTQGRADEGFLDRTVCFHNLEELHAALERGRGAILVTAHMGNWELAGQALASKLEAVYSVARPLRNPYIDRYLSKFRVETGQHIIERTGALKELVTVLRAGRLVVLLVDQHSHRGGIKVEFFGREAWMITTPAALGIRLGCPIAVGYSYRDDDGLSHHVVIDEVVEFEDTGDRKADVRRATEHINKRIEAAVRQHPEQWFWLHRRWKPGPPTQQKGT